MRAGMKAWDVELLFEHAAQRMFSTLRDSTKTARSRTFSLPAFWDRKSARSRGSFRARWRAGASCESRALRQALTTVADVGACMQDLKLARTNSSSGAASLWPQDEQSIKLILERFDPLQIEWELSSIGVRSDEQV